MAKFQFWEGGVKTENTQSAKKWVHFNFRGGGVVVSKLKILKVPRNGYISIFWGVGGWGVSVLRVGALS